MSIDLGTSLEDAMGVLHETAKHLRLDIAFILQAALVRFLESSEKEQIKTVERMYELRIQRLNHEGAKKG